MGSDNGAEIWIGLIIIVGLVLGGLTNFASRAEGVRVGEQTIRAEAVEHGHGEWVPDKNGKTTFKWKE